MLVFSAGVYRSPSLMCRNDHNTECYVCLSSNIKLIIFFMKSFSNTFPSSLTDVPSSDNKSTKTLSFARTVQIPCDRL